MIKIPSESGQFSQPNNGDRFGNIWLTKNINFDEEGYIKMSSGQYLMSSTDADFQDIEAMFASDSEVFLLSDDVFAGDISVLGNNPSNRTTSESAPTPGVEDDGVYFNNTEVISDGSSVYWNNSGTWTAISGLGLPSTGYVTCMEVFPEQNSLLIGRGNEVAIVSDTWVNGTNLILPTEYEVTSIVCIGSTAYIATRHNGNGDAKLFLWNGAGAANDGAYSVGATELSTIKNYQSSVCGVDSLGRFIRFNGGGFDVIATFPIYNTKYDWGDALNQWSFISNRGMVVDGDLAYFSVSSNIEDEIITFLDVLPGGLWCYDPKVGLYHKNGKTISKVISDTSVNTSDINTSTDTITVSGITVPATGTPVFYQASTAIGGLVKENWYFTIKVTDTTFKVAKTLQNSINGTAINLTSTSDFNEFYFVKRDDYSATLTDNRTSVLNLVNTLRGSSSSERIIHTNGNSILNASDTDVYGVNVMWKDLENRSYIITPKMYSNNIEDSYNKVTIRFAPLKYGDEIRLKYRTSERIGIPILPVSNQATNRATWTSTTTFTTTMDLSRVIVGDEVEVVGGQGAGHIAHISAISELSGTYTITIDDACPLVSNGQYMRYVINNWTYVDKADYTHEANFKEFPIDKQSDWIQFKIELRGTEVKISDIIVDNKSHSPVQK